MTTINLSTLDLINGAVRKNMETNAHTASVGKQAWSEIVFEATQAAEQFVTLDGEQISHVRAQLASLWRAERKLYLAYDTKADRSKYGRAWNAVRNSIVAGAKAAKDNPTVKYYVGFPVGIDSSGDGLQDHELVTIKLMSEHKAEVEAKKAAEDAETEQARAEIAAENKQAEMNAELERLSKLSSAALAAELYETILASKLDVDAVMAELALVAAQAKGVAERAATANLK